MKSVTTEDVVESFQVFDICLKDVSTIEQLANMAELYRMDGDSLVNQWLAFHSRNQQCTLEDNIDQFERELKQLQGKSKPTTNTLPAPQTYQNVITPSDDILEAYCSPASKKFKRPTQVNSPRTPLVNKHTSQSQFISPTSQVESPSQKFTQRTNSGEVVAQLCSGKEPSDEFWTNSNSHERIVAKKCGNSAVNLQKYMFQKIMDICEILNDLMESVAEEIQAHHKLDAFSPCATPSQNPVVTVGRIASESGGKLNPHSLILEGDRMTSYGRRVALDVEQLPEFSFFPGQIVAVEGTNPSGQKFLATKIYTLPNEPGNMRVADEPTISDQENLHVMVAAGPFTTTDSLSYEPLKQFISLVKERKPHLTILVGPMLDESHPELSQIQETFSSLANKWIDFATTALDEYTSVVIVPSSKDVFHHVVYPQPPYQPQSSSKNAFHMPDPVTFDAGMTRIGVTSTDVLFHLGAAEISRLSSAKTDRMSRLSQHLFMQKSYYPMYPAHESVAMDCVNAEFAAKMPEGRDGKSPELLVLPSDLRYFVREVDGRLCVNPGRLTRGENGGTYAHVVVGKSPGQKAANVVAKIVKL